MPLLDPAIALILLAAGRSERFGSDKLTALFRGRPLWEWAAAAAENAGFESLYLVIGGHSGISGRDGWEVVMNNNAERGLGTSISVGVGAASHHERVVIALADMPLMKPSHLRLLGQESGAIFTCQPDGTAGNPAAFGHEHFPQLRTLDGDRGARSLSLDNTLVIAPPTSDMLIDIDTPSDLAARQ
ncbi:nucleotidyltransferase family protein [Citromicrobium bathyomarinum]|uniref:nucleotidyltransferase family protein n=1 Tax=Citromicrobium bathyomarinum TaxID=72174 RepID=UPI00315B026D